jgi:hypothetical protein
MPGRCVPEKCAPTKSLGHSVPWTMSPLDDASLAYCILGYVIPDQSVLTLDGIEVLVKISFFGLCRVAHQYISV